MHSGETSRKMQYLGTFTVLLLMLANGASNGWNSPSLPTLLSDLSPLSSGSLTLQQGSWMTANICLGSIVGAPIFGWINERVGRKLTACMASTLQLIAWIFIAMAQNHYYLYISRFLVGFGGVAAFVVVPIYISEISETKIRGFLGSMPTLWSNFGVLLAFTTGAFVPCLLTPWIFIPLNILFLVGFIPFPETPTYNAKQGDFLKAEKSLRFYRGLSKTNACPQSFLEELAELKSFCADSNRMEIEKKFNMKQEIDVASTTTEDSNVKVMKKALIISMIICLLQQLCGCFSMFQYTEMIFKKAGSHVSPTVSAIIVSLIQVIGSYVSTLLIERTGRKPLLLLSSAGSGLGLIVFGTYFLMDSMNINLSCFQWLPLVSFSFVIFIANCGVLNLTYLVVAEILPTEIKSLGSALGNLLLNVVAFIFLLFLPQVMEEIGLYAALYTFAGFSLMGTLFIFIFLPETKGKSFTEISAALARD